MSWQFKIWNPTQTILKYTYQYNGSTGGIDGERGFTYRVRYDGNCIDLRYTAVPSLHFASAGDIVQLLIDNGSGFQPVWFGFLDVCPPSVASSMSEYVALGGFELFRSVLTYSNVDTVTDVGVNAQGKINGAHPAITYDPLQVPVAGYSMSDQYPLVVDLAQYLEALANNIPVSPKLTTGVNGSGVAFFKTPSGTASIGYSQGGFDYLPLRGGQIVTEGNVLIMQGPPKGALRSRLIYHPSSGPDIELPFPVALPVTATYQDGTNHPTYRKSKLVVYPNNPWDTGSVGSVLSSIRMNNTANAFDGNFTTGSDSIAGAGLTTLALQNTNQLWYGFQITYYLKTGLSGYVELNRRASISGGSYNEDSVIWALKSSEAVSTESFYAQTGVIGGAPPFTSIVTAVSNALNAAEFIVYEVKPFILSSRPTDYARSLIRLPFSTPAEVRWVGYQAVQPYLSITDVPGQGTVTGLTTEWEGNVTTNRHETVARLGGNSTSEDSSIILQVAERNRRLANSDVFNVINR